jgi:hypothetical protein
MNAQESIKNEEINSPADKLADLPVSDEQADRATGGTQFDAKGRLIFGTEGGDNDENQK